MTPRLSLLDLATVTPGQSVADAIAESVSLAQTADRHGTFERLWFAEHHNMPSIASAATSVLLAHVAAKTERIRVGSGGVMLPNHSPLTIAEQFGTLAELHPGRIDLGLGRAPGTDQRTVQALRRDPRASDYFPQDVMELQGYLSDESLVPGITAVPGQGTHVPLYILGSSMFGAQLAAQLGLPYAFASHFAPDHLLPAVAAYRERFAPSAQLETPYAIGAMNVIAADTTDEAKELAAQVHRSRVRTLMARSGRLPSDAEVDAAMSSPFADQVNHMMHYTAVGDAETVRAYVEDFADRAGVDEVMVTNQAPSLAARTTVLDILAGL